MEITTGFGPLLSPESLSTCAHPLLFLDTRPGTEGYASGHIEGALHADLNISLSTATDPGFDPAKAGRHPLPDLSRWSKQLGKWGIDPDTYVVAYDDASGANGACRLWWMLRAVGHTRVAVLDGGLRAAQSVGIILSQALPPSPPVLPPYPCEDWAKSQVTLDALEDILKDPASKVLDVRSRERWRGEVEPIDTVKGRIPGTVNLPYSESLDSQGRYKSSVELRKMFLELLDGISPKNLAVHCGSGVTACHTLLALENAGLKGAALYVGSYSEWSRKRSVVTSTPVA
jgi:thiosulfate/3-mercaptopyruvate sulfurtransferase